MARMLPRECRNATPSAAERRLFGCIEHELSDDWIALHSVGIARHRRKPWAEADFVLVGPGGVFVLEVKGGAVQRVERRWSTNGKTLKESPIEQAAGAAAALYADLAPRLPAVRASAVGHGVCFPDVRFQVGGAEVQHELIYDADDAAAGFDAYVDRLVAHWRARLTAVNGRQARPLAPHDVEAVVELLAPDFELVRSLRAEAGDVVRRLVHLTDEQVSHFRAFEENPRVLVRGGAGTGKTLLAAADAERAARDGARVLFVCHSNPLRDELRSRLDGSGVDVVAFQELCGKLISRAGLIDERPSGSRSQEYFDVHRPTLAMEAWAALDEPPQWDLLVVDEAQDLLGAPAAELLEMLVDGGWDHGRWRLFLDPVQDVFAASHADVVDKIAGSGFRVRLLVNCRNSGPIARDTAIATSTELSDSLAVDGPEPGWLSYRDEREHRKIVARQLREWLDAGIRPTEITIVSPVRRPNSVLAEGLPAGTPCSLVDGPILDRSRFPKTVQFVTAAAFKGLESDAVLVLDAPRFGERDRAAALYVGMTRARALLTVVRHAKFDRLWGELQRDFGRRLVQGESEHDYSGPEIPAPGAGRDSFAPGLNAVSSSARSCARGA